MPDWLVKLLDQWAVVMAAPIPFLIAVIFAAVVVWFALDWRYGAIIAKQSSEIRLLERQKIEAPLTATIRDQNVFGLK